jgi:hypothetical protein
MQDKDFSEELNENFKRRLEEIEEESNDRLRTIQLQEKELQTLKEQVKSLKQENSEKLRQVALQQEEKEDLINQLDLLKRDGKTDSSAKRSQEKLTERLEKLKQENSEKDKKITNLQDEVEKLKAKIEIFKNEKDEDDLQLQVATLEQENEEKAALLAKQEIEIKQLKKQLKRNDKSDFENGDYQSSLASKTSNQFSSNSKQDQSDVLKQALDEKLLIEKNVFLFEPTYTNNIPNSASAIFRSLLAWKSFVTPNTKLLNDITDAIDSITKVCVKEITKILADNLFEENFQR